MVAGAGVFGSTCVSAFVALFPWILRLKLLASAIFSGVVSVAWKAFIILVDSAFKSSNAKILAFTALLKAVFLAITSVIVLFAFV